MQVGGAGLFAVHLEIDGKPATERADGGHLHAALGIERRIADRYSLGIEGRFGTWDSTLSRRAQGSDGGLRWGGDAVFRLYMPTAINMSAVVAVAAGLTWPHMLDRPTRAVTESWQGRLGWNAGVDVGGENWFQLARAPVAWAAAFSLGYAIHAMTLDGRFTPVSEPAAAASARYRYLTHEFLLKMTLVVGS
jgi:hypothetical protein